MKIIYRNIVKFQEDKFPGQIKKAQDYLKTIYTDPDFDDIEYIFSSNYKGSHYFRNETKDSKYINPAICVANRSHLYLYKKKSLGLEKYNLNVGNYIQIICALIHELTHHIQYNENRGRSELETTRNEVEFLRNNYPVLYNQLIKSKN